MTSSSSAIRTISRWNSSHRSSGFTQSWGFSRSAVSATESFGATTVNGDVIVVDFKDAAPRTLDATTGEERGATVVRVPQTTNREAAAAVVTARSETGDVIIDDLR